MVFGGAGQGVQIGNRPPSLGLSTFLHFEGPTPNCDLKLYSKLPNLSRPWSPPKS